MISKVEHALTQSDYRVDPLTGIWSRPNFAGIDYSDGDETERRIGTAINNVSDLTVFSPELRSHCVDWASTYHLSSLRANILRPFQIAKGQDILEIGAGCGALSRYLGECGANVLALEGSLRRSKTAKSRTRDLPNVTVVAEKLSDFRTEQRFDVITLIGVLEYAGLYSTAENPAEMMLANVASLLKPNGLMVLAIENQLGLKYFAGAPEDHIGLPMYGLEGRYEKTQPRTYGRKALSELLTQAGLPVTSFLAPFPDYKLPISILSENSSEYKDFDGAAFAWQSAKRDPQLPSLLGFAPERVWPEVFRNGLGLELANSFLVVASSQPTLLPDRSVLAWHYSAGRAPQYCREAIFAATDADSISVTYRMLYPEYSDDQANSTLVRFECPETVRYTSGRLLAEVFIQAVSRDGWSIDDVGSFVRQYVESVETLLQAEGRVKTISSATDTLPGKYWDVIAQNIILCDNELPMMIDNEWTLNTDVEFGHCVLRSLLLLMATVTRFGVPANGQSCTRKAFIEGVFATSGVAVSETDITRYIELEASIQAQITGRPRSEFLNWSPDDLLTTQNMQTMVAEVDQIQLAANERLKSIEVLQAEVDRIQLVANERLDDIAILQAEVNQTQSIAKDHREEIKALRESISWKATAPLRRLVTVVRSVFIGRGSSD